MTLRMSVGVPDGGAWRWSGWGGVVWGRIGSEMLYNANRLMLEKYYDILNSKIQLLFWNDKISHFWQI